jgi:glycine/D-amino acid oxidase-like deaminating enzyme
MVKIENVRTCLRPCAPDDMPIIGPLRKYPDIFVNSGLGGKAANSFASGKLTAELIVHGEV